MARRGRAAGHLARPARPAVRDPRWRPAARPAAARPDGAARRAVAPGRRARRTHRRAGARAQGHRPRAGHRRHRRRYGDGAGTVVLATNTPILDRGGFFARVEPARSYGLAFRTPEPAVDGMYLSGGSAQPVAPRRPRPGRQPAARRRQRPHDRRGGSETARIEELRAWTAAHFPQAEETHAWSAQDYVPHHALPYAGPLLPGSDELLVAGGYSKWGMTNGVAAALALSGRILGGHLEWADVFEPWHSRELRGLVDAARVNAGSAWRWPRAGSGRCCSPGFGPAVGEGDGYVRLDHPGTPTAVARTNGVERRVVGRLHPPGRRRALERRRAQLGLPAPRQPVRPGRRGPRGTRHLWPRPPLIDTHRHADTRSGPTIADDPHIWWPSSWFGASARRPRQEGTRCESGTAPQR